MESERAEESIQSTRKLFFPGREEFDHGLTIADVLRIL